jgi:hypothetical protein
MAKYDFMANNSSSFGPKKECFRLILFEKKPPDTCQVVPDFRDEKEQAGHPDRNPS